MLSRIPPHLIVAISAWAVRGLQIVFRVLTLPILLSILSTTHFAALAILSSIEAWIILLDLGVGSSLQNFMSECRARDEDPAPYLRTGLCLPLMVPILALVPLVFAAGPIARWLFGELDPLLAADPSLVWIVGLQNVAFAVGSIGYRVYYARQRGFVAHAYQAVASFVTFLVTLSFIWYPPEAPLHACLIAWGLPQAIAALLAYRDSFLLARGSAFDGALARKIVRRAVSFGAFGFMAAGVLAVDYLVMSQTLIAQDIAQYNLLQKGFALVFFVYQAVLLAVWPVCAELLTARKVQQARGLLHRYMLSGFAVVIFGTACALGLVGWANHMLPDDIGTITAQSILLFGGYYLMRVWCDTYAMGLQSVSFMRPFWFYVPIQAGVSISAQYALSLLYGLDGILCGLLISFGATVFWALPYHFYTLELGVEPKEPGA